MPLEWLRDLVLVICGILGTGAILGSAKLTMSNIRSASSLILDMARPVIKVST